MLAPCGCEYERDLLFPLDGMPILVKPCRAHRPETNNPPPEKART